MAAGGPEGRVPPHPPGGSAFGFGAQGGQWSALHRAQRFTPLGREHSLGPRTGPEPCLPSFPARAPAAGEPSGTWIRSCTPRWSVLAGGSQAPHQPAVTPGSPRLGPTRQQGSSQPWPSPRAAVTCVCTGHLPRQPPSDTAAGPAHGHTRLAPPTPRRAQRRSHERAPGPG